MRWVITKTIGRFKLFASCPTCGRWTRWLYTLWDGDEEAEHCGRPLCESAARLDLRLRYVEREFFRTKHALSVAGRLEVQR